MFSLQSLCYHNDVLDAKSLCRDISLNQKFKSVTNFGFKPTFNNQSFEPIFETHIFDFSGDLYDQKIIVEFHDFIREEKKFSSLLELQKQIERDVKNAL
jgi:riboflavin kinase/FMN adenylyltransferase